MGNRAKAIGRLPNRVGLGGLVIASVIVLSACASPPAASGPAASVAPTATSATPSPAAEPVELSFLALITPSLTEEFWDEQLAAFTAAHPNITVRQIPGPTDMQAYVRQLIASGDVPDVGFAIAVNPDTAEHLAAWDQSDPDLAQIQSLDPQLVGGQLYALGTDIQARNTIFYNKDLFAEAGITEPPTTWEGITEACAKLRAQGINPFLVSGEWVTGRMFMGLNDIFIRTPDWYVKRASGEVAFSDPDWLAAAQRWQQWQESGCFNEGSLGIGYAQVEQEFLLGRGAMYQMGTWFTGSAKATPPEFEMGVFAPPSPDAETRLNGGIGSASYAVFKATTHVEEARTLAKWLAFDPTAHAALLDKDGLFSGLELASGTPDRDLTDLQKDVQALVASSVFTVDFNGQGDLSPAWAGVVDAINSMSQNLILGNDPTAELAALDEQWEQNAP